MNTQRGAVSEHGEQSAFVQHVLQVFGNRADFCRPLFFAIPNANKRTRWQAQMLRAEGMTRGAPDLIYLQPRGPHPYLAIEMKTPARKGTKGGGLTDEQRAFLHAAKAAGAMALVCYGADEAIEAFGCYMELEAGQA